MRRGRTARPGGDRAGGAAVEYLDEDEQARLVAGLAARLEAQRRAWRRGFAALSVLLALGVAAAARRALDLPWLPALLLRTTRGHPPSEGQTDALAAVAAAAFVAAAGGFFRGTRSGAYHVFAATACACILFMGAVWFWTNGDTLLCAMLLPVAYQGLAALVVHTLHDTDTDLERLRKSQYKFKSI